MEEIKVGEYVRTEYGTVAKIKHIIDFNKENSKVYLGGNKNIAVITNNPKEDVVCILIEEIVKHSPNTIDLIEVGDYVNGQEVVDKDEAFHSIMLPDGYNYYEHDIKTIVTKEQFKRVMYEVK